MLKNISCAAQCSKTSKQKKCVISSVDNKQNYNQLLEPDFPETTVKWNQSNCAPCKGMYTWISSPKAMYNNRKLIRMPTSEISKPQNIMYDKRVVRGTNFGQKTDACCQQETEAKRQKLQHKRITVRNRRGIIGTPPPIKGRKHENLQTDKYLEELFSRPPEYDVQCQTDLFLQRPPSPPYIPAKIGVDAITEILDGELFDFDTEVQPILETLVGRAVEQGFIEVMHEEELAEMRKQQQEFLTNRERELAELRRLEAEEFRLETEKVRRLNQEQISQELSREMDERVTAATLLQGHIADLLPGVLNTIEPYVEAANRVELEQNIGPWLAWEVAQEICQMINSRTLLEQIIREIFEERAKKYQIMEEVPVQHEEGEEEEEEELVEDDDENVF